MSCGQTIFRNFTFEICLKHKFSLSRAFQEPVRKNRVQCVLVKFRRMYTYIYMHTHIHMCFCVCVCIIFAVWKSDSAIKTLFTAFSLCNGKDESITNPVLGPESLIPKTGTKRSNPNELFGVTPAWKKSNWEKNNLPLCVKLKKFILVSFVPRLFSWEQYFFLTSYTVTWSCYKNSILLKVRLLSSFVASVTLDSLTENAFLKDFSQEWLVRGWFFQLDCILCDREYKQHWPTLITWGMKKTNRLKWMICMCCKYVWLFAHKINFVEWLAPHPAGSGRHIYTAFCINPAVICPASLWLSCFAALFFCSEYPQWLHPLPRSCSLHYPLASS